jgi:hypothetical protein
MSIPIVKENRSCLLSLILPTRGRTKMLDNTLTNILTQSDQDNINFEIIVKVDSDDIETIEFIKNYPPIDNIYFLISPRKKGYESLILATDDMTNLAHGKYILGHTNDSLILTKNWNTILEKKLTDFKFYFPKMVWPGRTGNDFVYDTNIDTGFVIYPRKLIEIWGDIAPHTLIDSWFLYLGTLATHPAWGLDLIEHVPEIVIKHLAPQDKESKEKENNDAGRVYSTYMYHRNSKEIFHYLNLLDEYLKRDKWEQLNKHNIINEYLNNNG